MGKINIFQGFSNEYKTYKANGKLCDIIKDFCPEMDLSKCAILNSGNSENLDYVVKNDDIIFIRETPTGVTCAIVMAIIGTACAAISLGVGIASAVKQREMAKEAAKAEKIAKKSQEEVKQLPFLKGAKNKSALGYNIPFVMGSMYNVPYLITTGFYSLGGTDGSEQYWHVSLCIGYSSVMVNNISIGHNVFCTSDNYITHPVTNERIHYITPHENKGYWHSGTYYPNATNNEIEVRESGDYTAQVLQGLNEKVTSTSYGDEIPGKTSEREKMMAGVSKQLEENTYKADVCISFNGLRYLDSDGDWCWKTVKVRVDYSYDSGVHWTKAHTFEICRNSDRTMRFETTIEFPTSCYGKDINVRVVRETAVASKNSQESCYLQYINCHQYDPAKSVSGHIVPCQPLETEWRDRVTRIGLRLIANDSTKDQIDEINCMIYGKARIWKNKAWTTVKYPTRNPASWILEIFTSSCHPYSQFTDDEIDLESLGALYEYCDEKGYHCDGIITDDTKKSDVLNQILTECDASMFIANNGKWTVAIEKEQTTPIALLNEQSVKSVTVSKTFERRPFGLKATFTNRTAWKIDTLYFAENNGNIITGATALNAARANDKTKTIQESAMKYITQYEHAFAYLHRQLAKSKLQPREITVSVGREGDYYPLYSLVLLQLKQLKVGLSSGTIHNTLTPNGVLTSFETSDICDFSDTSKRYGIIIQASNRQGKGNIYIEVEPFDDALKTKSVKVKNPTEIANVEFLSYGNIYSFGYLNDSGDFEKITNKMMIYGTKPTADGWELTLKDYNDEIFSLGTIPEYKTNLTTPRTIETPPPTITYGDIERIALENVQSITENEKPNSIQAITALATKTGLLINCTENDDGSGVSKTVKNIKYEISKDAGENWSELGQNFLTYEYKFNRSVDGFPEVSDMLNWKVRAKPLSTKTDDDWAECLVDTSSYGTWEVLPPVIESRVSSRSVTLVFEKPTRTDGKESYSSVRYNVQVKRIQGGSTDENWYKPEIQADPYSSENAYKNGDGFVTVGDRYQQIMPLVGQDATDSAGNAMPCPCDTAYSFNVQAVSVETGGVSDWKTENVIALATNAKDIVENAITTNKLADNCVTFDKIHADIVTSEKGTFKDLASQNLVLGKLSGNGINADANNFWILNDAEHPERNGEFRIGNDINYEDVNTLTPTGENASNAAFLHFKKLGEVWHLAISLTKFVISTLATMIRGVFKVTDDAGSSDFLTVNPNDTEAENGTPAKTVRIGSRLTSPSTVQIGSKDQCLCLSKTYLSFTYQGRGASIVVDETQSREIILRVNCGDTYRGILDADLYGNADTATTARHVPLSQPDDNEGAIWLG